MMMVGRDNAESNSRGSTHWENVQASYTETSTTYLGCLLLPELYLPNLQKRGTVRVVAFSYRNLVVSFGLGGPQ